MSCRRHLDRERGSAVIEAVIGVPAFMLFVALIVFAGRVAIAHQGVQSAAADGLSAASSFVTDAGGEDVLPGAQMTGGRSATTATVTVTGTSLSVIPGWSPAVSQSASVPVERITR